MIDVRLFFVLFLILLASVSVNANLAITNEEHLANSSVTIRNFERFIQLSTSVLIHNTNNSRNIRNFERFIQLSTSVLIHNTNNSRNIRNFERFPILSSNIKSHNS